MDVITSLLGPIKSLAKRIFLAFPTRVCCTICGWRGRRFVSDSWHPFTICPICNSQIRHRLLQAALQQQQGSSEHSVFAGKSVLHFAPEKVLSMVIAQAAGTYVSADFLRTDVDKQLDISNMPSVADSSFDFIIACDVLEHVADDFKAMHEIRRALRPGGQAILTVPQKDFLEHTYEDSLIVTDAGRLEAFGQEDHLRIYGDDFPELLKQNGFEVMIYDADSFGDESVRKHVLFPPILSTNPLATNFRKVYFAKRPA
jgi:SAM-dependent methyltransferase